MKIVGISAFYHDSAAALIENGEILAAAQEERFTRKKYDPSFPKNALTYCLESTRTSYNELAAIVFYDKPLLKFERLLETYYAFAPKGARQFWHSMPVWLKEKLFLKNIIFTELTKLMPCNKKDINLLFSEHHLSHAASAFYPSPFQESAILTIDGVGEWATTALSQGNGQEITIIKEIKFPHSLGMLYSAFTYYTGFKVNSGEYKLMGLAPYGDPTAGRVSRFVDLIYEHLIDLKDDGSFCLNQEYFDYCTGLKMVKESKWKRLFGFPPRKPESEIQLEYCDLAMAIQKVTEEIILKLAQETKRLTNSSNLCLAGGVALNCVANGLLLRKRFFDNLWIQPAAGDAGGALGAALTGYYLYFDKKRKANPADSMQGSYLGPQYYVSDIEVIVRQHGAVYERYGWDELYNRVADLLAEGNVIGWFQGRMEWGPRALGNRSILADARNPQMQKKLNLKIKYREGFRPFAPSVLYEDVKEYFEQGFYSPYMLLLDHVHSQRRNPLPEGYYAMSLKDRLYYPRSDIPAITHLDYSARLQTVHKETNPRYHELISAFKAKTGYGVIVNTSFNVRGEPIVCRPDEAYNCFMRTEMDYLVIENYLFDKTRQPEWTLKKDGGYQYG